MISTLESPDAPREDRAASRDSILLFAILALALALRVPGLLESVWYDEIWSTRINLYSAGELVRSLLQDLHPPVYTFFMFIWIRLFGDSELSIRMPPLLLGLATVLLGYRVACRFAPRPAALVWAFLVAVSPVHIWYSQEARSYSAVLFLVLLATEALYRIAESRRWRLWVWVYALSLTCAVFSHYYVIALIPAFAFFGPKAQRTKLIVIDLIVGLAMAAFLYMKSRTGKVATEAVYLRSFDLTEAGKLYDWLLTGNSLWGTPPWQTWPLAVVPWVIRAGALLLLALGVRALLRHSRRDAIHLFLLLLATPTFLAALNVAGFDSTYIERSALVTLPFFLLLLAAGIHHAARGAWRIPAAAAVGVTVIAALAGFYTNSDRWTVYKPNADWRGAAAHLRSLRSPQQPLILFVSTPAPMLNYYRLDASEREVRYDDVVNSPPVPAGLLPGGSSLARLKRVLNQVTAFGGPQNLPPPFLRGSADEIILLYERDDAIVPGVLRRTGTARFFLIEDRFWPGGFSTVFADVVQNPRYRLASRTQFKGVEIREYRISDVTR